MTSICVFMGANLGNNPDFLTTTLQLGKELATRNIRLIYGGSTNGLMGKLADCVLEHGGTVTGVMATTLRSREISHPGLTEFHLVDTLRERKKLMAELADAFITLPGGLGTLEEMFEVWNAAKIGVEKKPLGLLNVAGYYDHLLEFLQLSVKAGFIKAPNLKLIHTETDSKLLIEQLIN